MQSDSATLTVQANSLAKRIVGGSGNQTNMVPQAMRKEVLDKLPIMWSQLLQTHSTAAVPLTDPTPQPGHSDNDQGVPGDVVEQKRSLSSFGLEVDEI